MVIVLKEQAVVLTERLYGLVRTNPLLLVNNVHLRHKGSPLFSSIGHFVAKMEGVMMN